VRVDGRLLLALYSSTRPFPAPELVNRDLSGDGMSNWRNTCMLNHNMKSIYKFASGLTYMTGIAT
jgi:hypothetical protein